MPTVSQVLEFNAGTGLTISCKLFAIGSDTVVSTQTATEKTNDKNRYSVTFTDIPAGAYRLGGFVSGTGGFANEVYDLLLADGTYYPRSESSVNSGAIADAVWDEAYNQHTSAGTFGKLLDTLRKANYTIDGAVVAGGTLSTTTFRTNVVATTSAYAHSVLLFVTGPLAGENSPILSYTSTNGVIVLEEALTAIPSPGDEFIIAAAQHVHAVQDIADAIELTVLPLDATVVDRVAGTTINLFTDETPVVVVAVVDADGNNVDLTSLSLEVIIELRPSTDVVVIADGSITHSNGSFAFTVPSAVTNAPRACKWALRKTNDDSVLVQGDLFVNYAPSNDA